MSVRLPLSASWKQTNASDKEADVFYTENINFDERGYAKLSPRMVRVYSDNDNGHFDLPLAIGRTANGEYQVLNSDSNWQVVLSNTAKTLTKDSDASAPTCTFDTDGAWFKGLWHASEDTSVRSRPATGGASQAWTSRVTGLTSGIRHLLAVFQSRVSLCVSNGNVLKQYNSAYSNTTDLTIPSDFEISGIAYNKGEMGIITRLANDGTKGQDQSAMFYTWGGATTGALSDASLNSDAGIAICAYGSSFVVLTRSGELKYWNGGGFQTLAFFPIFNTEHNWGDSHDNNALGNVFMKTDGNLIHIHIGNQIDAYGIKQDRHIENFPAGAWCYDSNVGLYHRYKLSNSPAYVYNVTSGNVDASTDTMTLTAGTVPATGNVARALSLSLTGITANKDYYIIKTGATTFKLATTRELAFAGSAVDITGASGTTYFLMIDHKDYGASHYSYPGAVTLTADRNMLYTDIVAGGRIVDTDLTDVHVLCMAVPGLENNGVITFPKMFASNVTDTPQKFVVRFRPLGVNDSIKVNVRTKDVIGLPASTAGLGATWTGTNGVYTSQDLSEAKTYLDAGGAIQMHIISGVGAGERVQVSAIDYSDGVYGITLEHDISGVVASDECDFQLTNYATVRTITDADNDDGFIEVPLDANNSKFAQVQLELHGDNVTIEDAYYQNSQHQ